MMAGFDFHSFCAHCCDKKKGSDPCVETPPAPCHHCDALTADQKPQLSTPPYKLKKEKREAKTSTPAKDSDTLSPTLVDTALVSVMGVVDGQGTSGASGLSGPEEKKKKSEKKTDKKSSTSSKSVKPDKSVKSSSSRPASSSSTIDQGKSIDPSTDSRFSDLDRKWSDWFNRLEALLMAKTLDRPQEPVFGTVRVTPTYAPPADVVLPDPFIHPSNQLSQPTDPALALPTTLPFRFRPNLSRIPTVISCYGNPHRNVKLLEALHQLMDKNTIELVHKRTSLGFFNRLFLVPKPNNKWRPILDLSNLNFFLKTEKFKMETPETIRTSLQKGEWVTSIDFRDAYFYIPIQEQSRKYLRFHFQGQTYQFKALPFGLSTAPMEFTIITKEVKLMAIQNGIRIHQYLDDWLVRATSHRVCLQHTQALVRMCRHLGWPVNVEKSELEPKQVFNFVGYQFDLESSRVRPTPDWWQSLQEKILELISRPACSVRELTTHEAHPMASQKKLENTGIVRKMDSPTQISTSSFTMVARRRQCPHRPAITPYATCSANLYGRIKRRVGRSLKRVHCQRNLVPTGKQITHKLPGTKSSLSGSKRVPKTMHRQTPPPTTPQ